jgi:hypothetical protein
LLLELFFQRSVLGFAERNASDSGFTKKLLTYRKQFEVIIRGSEAGRALYQFRELYERYTGLSLAVKERIEVVPDPGDRPDLLRFSGKVLPAAADACLLRRNRKLLVAHQRNAREEFAAFLERFGDAKVAPALLGTTLREYLELIGDTGVEAVERFGRLQIAPSDNVRNLETELWNASPRSTEPATPQRMNVALARTAMSASSND